METTPKIGAYNYRYGAIAAGIGIVFSLMLHFMDMTYSDSPIIQATYYAVPTAFAIIAIISFRKANNGFLRLNQSIKLGVGVFLVSGIIGFLYSLVYTNTLEPDFTANFAQIQAYAIREAQPEVDENIIQMQQESIQKYFHIGYFVFFLIPSLLVGLIVGLITGLFAKKS